MVSLGVERTIEQDPAFAIRVMVDVATRALSPAVNDPSTAVQVLDHLGETLRMIGTAEMPSAPAAVRSRDLQVWSCPCGSGVITCRSGITEIREYGGDSVQVVRRLRALLDQLADLVLPENRPAVEDEIRRLEATAGAAFADRVDRDLAGGADSQGIGGPATQSRRDGRPSKSERTSEIAASGDRVLVGSASAGVVLPVRVWRDYLSLGVTEIREYGGDSVQVVRRLRALLEQLADLVLPENRPAVEDELRRLEATAAAAFGDRIDKDLARGVDSQGIGGPARHRVETAAP